jgi:hypothetical protein
MAYMPVDIARARPIGETVPCEKTLHQDLPSKDKGIRGVWHTGAESKAGNIVINHHPKPKSQMGGRGATCHHLVAQLLGEEGLALGDDAGHSQPPTSLL